MVRGEAVELEALIAQDSQGSDDDNSLASEHEGQGRGDDLAGNRAPIVQETSFVEPKHETINDVVYEVRQATAPQSITTFIIQVIPSLLLAGAGMIAAGTVLDIVQHWTLYIHVSEMFILVPALLGLKGNLEMTFASRLSTASNRGDLSNSELKWRAVTNNLLLIQVQALVVSLVAALFSILLGVMVHHEFDFGDSVIVCGSAILTASIASGVLGVTMALVVVNSKTCGIDPDNVATPIAASLGDLVTLSILSGLGSGFFSIRVSQPWVCPVVTLLLVGVIIFSARRLKEAPGVLQILQSWSTWGAILIAMVISSLSGLILERFVSKYEGMAVLAPLINGVGGNLAAIQASRISTSLHTNQSGAHLRTALVLLALVIPISLFFLIVINFMEVGHTSMTMRFLVGYSLAALVQVALLLAVVKKFIHLIWRNGLDPDDVAIPFVTAFGDFLGTAALTACFVVLFYLGDRDSDIGD